MVYAKTFTTFARHAFQKAAFTGHANASPSGAAHASSFFNQSFAGAGRSQLGHGAIANRFQTQFGAHAGKNNPSQGNGQTSLYGQLQNSMAASTTNDDGSKEQEAIYRPHTSLTRRFQNTIFAPISDDLPQTAGARQYSTSIPEPAFQPDMSSEGFYSNINPVPNLPESSPDYVEFTVESYEKEALNFMQKGDYTSVVSVYHDMKRQGFVPTPELYNYIIDSLSRTRAQEPVNAIVEAYTEMLERQITPLMSTVSTVIKALCERSSEVSDIIAETNLRIERDASNTNEAQNKVKLLQEEENVSTALHLFHATSETGYLSHSVDTFNALLRALSIQGMAAEVLQVYEKMEVNDIKPDVNTFVHLITAFGKHGDLRSVIECYNEYKAKASNLYAHDENQIYQALILSYFAAGDPSGGVEFLKKIQAVPGKYVSRNLFDAVVAGLCQRGEIDTALQWVHRMEKDATSPKPTTSTVRPILLFASRENNLAQAKEAFEIVAKLRTVSGSEWKSEVQSFASLCLREGDLATAVIVMDELILQRIFPDSDVAANFLSSLLKTSGPERALEYFERLLQSAQHGPLNDETVSELQVLATCFITDLGVADANVASRLMAALQPFPTVLTREPSEASRALVAAFKDSPDNTVFDGVTLASLIKFQASLTGWNESKDFDVNDLISMLCAIRPDEWICLRPARQVITDHLVRIGDQGILSLWREIMNSIDLVDNDGISPVTPSLGSIPSNHSPDDVNSQATFETAMTSSMSVIPPSPPLRPLPSFYLHNQKRAPDFNLLQSRRIIKNLGKVHAKHTSEPGILNSCMENIRYLRSKGERVFPEALQKIIEIAGKLHRVNIVTEVFDFAQATVQEVVPEHEVAFNEWCMILNSMIVAHAFNHNFEKARYFQQELMDLGVAPNSDAFAAYIVNLNVTDTNDEATEALALFHESRALGVQPSSFLYNTLISKLAKARRSEDALYYFHEMRVHGIGPTSVTFGTIINACCRVGNEELAVKYFNEMESHVSFIPRIAPYNTMLQFYVQTKQSREEALQFYEKMRAQHLVPSAHTYKLLIDAYATLEPVDIKAAENVLNLIAADRQSPTSSHFAALVHAYGCVLQALGGAKDWFETATDPEFSNSVAPDETLYQALIEAYVANHNVAECGEIFQQMEKDNVKLTVYMANHLIHGWAVAGNLEEARRVFDSLGDERIKLYGREPSTYEQMTRAYLAMGDREGALALVEEMKTKRYPPAVVARVTDILKGSGV